MMEQDVFRALKLKYIRKSTFPFLTLVTRCCRLSVATKIPVVVQGECTDFKFLLTAPEYRNADP